MGDWVRVDTIDAVAVVTLNNVETRNALSRGMLEMLSADLVKLNADDHIRAIVLTGAGDHFCAGGDISGMITARTVSESRSRIPVTARIARELMGGAKPVISAVEGWAAGAGLSLVSASDFVVSSSQARYAAAFGKMGLLPDMGLLWSLPQRIGLVETKRLLFTGCTIDANKALALGLADQLCEPGEAREVAIELACEFTNCAPLPMAIIKSSYAAGLSTLGDALRCELDNQPGLFQTQDHREAVAAFLDKRKPVYRNS
ncbi:enoyl-CoA hydratase/isomerase family protein [Pseudomonas sp. BF-R-19]|uniref:enoyl-CoA hydratase/isomerase family protein n=1 Tax=Pseudomonas sp. BF-R-19 TaxID=2832397 RepID=UPI001CBBF641|nr:enoyl-CoA hydratase/isomerase family protein [Pseudomonas sp. BF-R-19]